MDSEDNMIGEEDSGALKILSLFYFLTYVVFAWVIIITIIIILFKIIYLYNCTSLAMFTLQ